MWGSACVLLGFFAAHSISTITHALGVTSAVVILLVVVGVLWAWHRRSQGA
jgi:membrane protein DedA with SNARE-associated domain